MTTKSTVEPFVDHYRRCSCCKFSLHEYMYPYQNAKHTTRNYRACIACSRECYTSGQRARSCRVAGPDE